MSTTFEEHKQFLQKESAGTNLYDHISEVLLQMIKEKPSDPVALFENVSANVKDTSFNVKDVIEGESLPGQGEVSEKKSAQSAWTESASALFKVPEEFDEAEHITQDWAGDSAMLEWAGVSFGKEESYRLSLALKHLAVAAGANDLRLWGKITGIKSDYYIAEGNTAEGVDSGDKNKMDYYDAAEGEGYRIGANAHTYWVCSYAGGDWVKLPDVTCEQIVTSRKLRKMFTGDLDAAVNGYPNFNGTEKNYLRAIIARISSDTVIVPDGVFTADTRDGIEDEAELMVMVNEENDSTPDMTDLASWVHLELGLNKIGRATPFPSDPEKEDEEENPDAELAGKALRAVQEDVNYENYYIKKVSGQFAVIRNLKWPGAYTAANQLSYANIYVGTGVEYSATPYKPQLPPALMGEWKPSEEDLPGEDDPAYCGAVLKFHEEDKIQFDPHKQEEVDDE